MSLSDGSTEGSPAQTTTANKKRRGNCLGCLILCCILAAWAIWMIREPTRNASKFLSHLEIGMTVEQVESLRPAGRCLTFYSIGTTNDYRRVDRHKFMNPGPAGSTNVPPRRMNFTFLSITPGRISIDVAFDANGIVSGHTKPHFWD